MIVAGRIDRDVLGRGEEQRQGLQDVVLHLVDVLAHLVDPFELLPHVVQMGRYGVQRDLLVQVGDLLVGLLGDVAQRPERLTDALVDRLPGLIDLLLQHLRQFHELLVGERLSFDQGNQDEAGGGLLDGEARLLCHAVDVRYDVGPLTVDALQNGVPALGVDLAFEGLSQRHRQEVDEAFHGLLQLRALSGRQLDGVGPR